MANLTEARKAVAAALNGIEGIDVYWYMPDGIAPPAIAIEPAGIDYQQTFRSEVGHYTLSLIVIAGRTDEESVQEHIDELVSPDAAGSVPKFLRNDPTLGGAVAWVEPVAMSGYGRYDVSGVEYLGATITVEVQL